MNSTQRQCFDRLLTVGTCYPELKAFMLDEGFLTKSDLPFLLTAEKKPKFLLEKLLEAQDKGLIQLMSFEWSLLPTERIHLQIVTARSTQNFSYETV